MNIIDAKRTGKRLRPLGGYTFNTWDQWHEGVIKNTIDKEWEIEEESKLLTWEHVKQAIIFGLACDLPADTSLYHIKKRLGFE